MTRKQRVMIERHGDWWWVMFASGGIAVFESADAALKVVKARARRGNRDVTLTTIEWRNVPEGWEQPS